MRNKLLYRFTSIKNYIGYCHKNTNIDQSSFIFPFDLFHWIWNLKCYTRLKFNNKSEYKLATPEITISLVTEKTIVNKKIAKSM